MCKCSANLEMCLWWVKREAPKVGSTIQFCIMKYSVIKIIYVVTPALLSQLHVL